MRLGIVSDLHANSGALEAVLEVFHRAKVDDIVCLGDLIGYGPFPNETINLVREASMRCTLGSADEKIAFGSALQGFGRGVADTTLSWTRGVIGSEQLGFLRTLPVQQTLETPAGRLLFFHGLPDDTAGRLDLSLENAELERVLQENRVRFIACGGSHIPYKRELRGGCLINPGSVGLSLNGEPGADYALVDIGSDEVTITLGKARYDFAAVAFDIIAWGLPEVVAETVRYGRPPLA